MKQYFSVVLYLKDFFCLFQHKLHQCTNAFNYHGNDGTVDRSVCSDPENYSANMILIVYSSSDIKTESVSSNEESNSTVRQQWKCGKEEVKEEI